MKTGFGVLVMALNIGIDPPNEIKTDPCARVECWIDPMARPAAESLPRIGKALQSQVRILPPQNKQDPLRLLLDLSETLACIPMISFHFLSLSPSRGIHYSFMLS